MLRHFCLALCLLAWVFRGLAADEKLDRLVVATWNVEWFFDHYKGDNHSDPARKQSFLAQPVKVCDIQGRRR